MNHQNAKQNLQVRRAIIVDAAAIADMTGAVQQGHVESRPDLFKPHQVTPEMIAEYESQLSDPDTYVYIGEVDGVAIGYILATMVNAPENSYMFARHALHVYEMSVNPEHRSAGYGEQLMEQVFALAKSLNISSVTLDVYAYNERAKAFYERLGFFERSTRMEARVE